MTARVICAIIGVTTIEVCALLTGHNGTMLRVAMVAIAGLGGFSLAALLKKG